jgi:hypothetical protein
MSATMTRGAERYPGSITPADPQPWDPQPGETARAYEAFELYRDMGPSRSLTRASQAVGKSTHQMSMWSARHSWVYRAASWDAEQRRLKQEDRAVARKEAVDREGRVASLIIAQALKHIRPPEKDTTGRKLTEEERQAWKPKPDVLRMATYSLRYASEVERLALGLPTSITKNQQETEEAIREAQAAQRATIAIITEGLCEEPDCECCRRIRDRVGQAVGYHARVEARLTPATV